jgi:hypothetical protein
VVDLGPEGGDEGGCRIAIESAATLLEELGFGVEGRVLVERKEARFDLHHFLGAGRTRALMREDRGGKGEPGERR